MLEHGSNKNIQFIDYDGLLGYEDVGFTLRCACCGFIITETLSEHYLMLNYKKTIAVGVPVNDKEAEFYCKRCYDKINC